MIKREAEKLKRAAGWKIKEIKKYGSLTREPMIYTKKRDEVIQEEETPVEQSKVNLRPLKPLMLEPHATGGTAMSEYINRVKSLTHQGNQILTQIKSGAKSERLELLRQ